MSELTVRASSWGALFDCAHKWEGTHLLGMRMPSGPRALLGTAIHAGTAAFDLARMNGAPITPYDAGGVMVEALQHPEYEVDWHADDLRPADAEKIGLNLLARYCTEVSPRYTFEAVELTTKPYSIDCGSGTIITLTGTLDRCRVRASGEGRGISDVKTGGAAVQKGQAKIKGHRAQLGTYELLYEFTTNNEITEPGEIIGMKTKGAPEVAVSAAPGCKDLMIGSDRDPGLLEFAAQMFRAGLFPPNPSSHLCSPKYCARWTKCKYHD